MCKQLFLLSRTSKNLIRLVILPLLMQSKVSRGNEFSEPESLGGNPHFLAPAVGLPPLLGRLAPVADLDKP